RTRKPYCAEVITDCGLAPSARPGVTPARTQATHHVSLVPVASFAAAAHSPAATLGPSDCTRVTLKRPSAQTTVTPSASTATISPILPPMPFGSLAGIGLASKIFTVVPPSFDRRQALDY